MITFSSTKRSSPRGGRCVVGEEVFEAIRREAEPYYRHSHHDRFHVERVYKLALRIAGEVGQPVDLEVLRAAVLLHDVARTMEDEGLVDDHAREGARIAHEILRRVGFPRDRIEKVAYCTEVHRFKSGVKPETIEAQILQDADRSDMLGAVGVARVSREPAGRTRPSTTRADHPNRPTTGARRQRLTTS
uniref:HD domain-containing protein n=1 Tax=Thermofilum pendens TaxID=2269 RepID=A0A7C4FFF6_THEPE